MVLQVHQELQEQQELVVLQEQQVLQVLVELREHKGIKEVYYINSKLRRIHQVNLDLVHRHLLIVLMKYILMILHMTEQTFLII